MMDSQTAFLPWYFRLRVCLVKSVGISACLIPSLSYWSSFSCPLRRTIYARPKYVTITERSYFSSWNINLTLPRRTNQKSYRQIRIATNRKWQRIKKEKKMQQAKRRVWTGVVHQVRVRPGTWPRGSPEAAGREWVASQCALSKWGGRTCRSSPLSVVCEIHLCYAFFTSVATLSPKFVIGYRVAVFCQVGMHSDATNEIAVKSLRRK